MKFLIDTNIFIPLEPTSATYVEEGASAAARLARLAAEGRHQLYVHPLSLEDIDRDEDAGRRRLRRLLFGKYPSLPAPPPISPELQSVIGSAASGTNDWVDHHLLAALMADAVDYLVTEDRRLRNKASRLGVQLRVATLAEAISVVQDLFDVVPPTPPAVQGVKAHQLRTQDPIFDSFRADYPPFDSWLAKCKREHRDTWIIQVDSPRLAAVCIVKPEKSGEFDLEGKLLKICSFKVSDEYNGFRFGELLLKTVFAFAERNRYDWLYMTVFEKHGGLISLLEEFGFRATGQRGRDGDPMLAKPMKPAAADMDALDPLEFNIRYGPNAVQFVGVPAFLVPIKPEYHRLLFPEGEVQLELTPGVHPFGNSIRKAYLCHAAIRSMASGAVLLFYRSVDTRGVTAVGIAEDTLVSKSPNQIARYVGKRTVYSFLEIERLCASPVLAILFRQVRLLKSPIHLNDLVANGVVGAAPQSVATIPEVAKKWLQTRLK